MSKHTPGQWYWDFDSDGLASLRSNAGGGEAIMIDVGCYPELADRCLIAAAPDLLEALIDARRALELANFTGELAVVDAAIASAKGESQ